MRISVCRLARKLPVRRNHPINFNNAWQLGRELKVEQSEDRAALTSMGIEVLNPREVITSSYLAPYEIPKYEVPEPVERTLPEKNESHPLWKERPVHNFNDRTYYPRDHQLDIAKNLTKSVEITEGLPGRIYKRLETLPTDEAIAASVQNVIKEAQMFDSTLKKLSFNYKVPYIGWHPVNDRMTSKMPYPVTMSWQRKEPRKFGIPLNRKSLNTIRGLLRVCDHLSLDIPNVLYRVQYETKDLRQYFERLGAYTRVSVKVPFSVWDKKGILAYADAVEINATASVQLPDIYPMEAQTGLWPINIYREENNLPVLEGCSLRAHTIVNNHNNPVPDLANDDQFAAKALTLSFASALGQARQIYGSDVSGVLPEPIVVHFINTDRFKFHLSAFQLNTLDLNDNEGVKNIFWHEKNMSSLFEVCQYVEGKPTLQGYNHSVFLKILSMYQESR